MRCSFKSDQLAGGGAAEVGNFALDQAESLKYLKEVKCNAARFLFDVRTLGISKARAVCTGKIANMNIIILPGLKKHTSLFASVAG